MNNVQSAYHLGMMENYGYNPNYVGSPYYPTQTSYPSPNNVLVYGPYKEGPSSQMLPPDWFEYYVHTNPYINPSNVPNYAYYMNPQFLPRIRW